MPNEANVMLNRNNMLTNKYVVFLLAFLACILWATAFPFLKLSYAELGIKPDDIYLNLLFAAYRFFAAGMILFGYLLIRKQPIIPVKASLLGPLLILGLFQTSLQYFFFYIGLAHTTGVKASILGAIGIFFAVILAHFIYRDDRISWYKVVGLLVGFAGVIAVNLVHGKLSLDFTWLGEGFIIFSALGSTVGSVFAKDISAKVNTILASAYQLVLGSIMLFGVAITKVSPLALQFNAISTVLLLWLASLSAVAFPIWYLLLKYNPLSKVSIYKFLIPVFGAIFSALLVPGESLNMTVILALVLVSMGIIVVHYEKSAVQESAG